MNDEYGTYLQLLHRMGQRGRGGGKMSKDGTVKLEQKGCSQENS